MKASVIIANYNNAKFVKDCLNSLISQTYKNVEIIFFDDNSLDESIEIVEKYENIKIIKNKENYICAIRRQLETQYETELNRAQQREVDHRKEIVRILSTHEVSSLYSFS